MESLKSEILRLLEEDEELRYAVAKLIGPEEILKRLDGHRSMPPPKGPSSPIGH